MNTTPRYKKKTGGKTITKKITGWLHLWLGLVSGIILLAVTLSGTVFVFCDEIIDAFGGSAKYVSVPKNQKKMTPDELILKFEEQIPNREPFYVDVYKNENRSFRIASATKPNPPLAKPKPGEKPKRHRGVFAYHYLDPYTGKVLGSTKSYEFFYVVAHIHAQLLAGKFGKSVVGIASIIFFIQLIGGLILWWPKKWTKTTRTAAFKIKKGTKWRRKNYDFHNVFGFYALLPAIFLTITGLIMSYEILAELTQKTFGGNPDAHEAAKKYYPEFQEKAEVKTIDYLAAKVFKENPQALQFRTSILHEDDEKETTRYSTVGKFIGLKSQIEGRQFLLNKYTGEEVKFPHDIEMHEKIETTNFDLHVGYWWGMFGKIFTFIVGIICSSLPITGFLIWWGRRNKSGNKNKKIKNVHQHRLETQHD